MGSLSAVARRSLSPERARLVAAVKRSRYTLRELSEALGRNPSYLQQFIVKGSPRALPEDVRHRLAAILHISEVDLRAPMAVVEVPPLPLAALVPAPEAPTGSASAGRPPHVGQTGALPLLPEDRIGEPPEPDSVYPASALAMNIPACAVAVRLTQEHGILQPRHILICDPATRARIGDVAIVRAPSCRTVIGLLISGAKGSLTVREGAEDHTLLEEAAVVWRVLAMNLE